MGSVCNTTMSETKLKIVRTRRFVVLGLTSEVVTACATEDVRSPSAAVTGMHARGAYRNRDGVCRLFDRVVVVVVVVVSHGRIPFLVLLNLT